MDILDLCYGSCVELQQCLDYAKISTDNANQVSFATHILLVLSLTAVFFLIILLLKKKEKEKKF